MSSSHSAAPQVGVIMGSDSDWTTMRPAVEALEAAGIPYEKRVVSAHRTPDDLFEYAGSAESRGLSLIIAGAGGAAHLPGMTAAKTIVPVIGVPVAATLLKGIDALLSILQMPAEIGVATVCVGKEGAKAAGILASRLLNIPRGRISVGLIYESSSDHAVLQHTVDRLTSLNVPFTIASALPSSTEDDLRDIVQRAGETVGIWITASGPRMHLATRLVNLTSLGVLNVPTVEGSVDSVDRFVLPFLHLPPGIASFALGKAGAINAALFAATVVSERDSETWKMIRKNRQLQVERVRAMKLE